LKYVHHNVSCLIYANFSEEVYKEFVTTLNESSQVGGENVPLRLVNVKLDTKF